MKKNLNTFGLHTPMDLLGKLERELKKLVEESEPSNSNHRNQGDTAFNLSVTCWHMVDWVWRSCDTPPVRFDGRDFSSFDELHSHVRAACPELQDLYEIALGAKHFEIVESKRKSVKGTGQQVLQDDGVVRSVIQPVVRPVVRSVLGCYHEKLVIQRDDGRKVPFLDVARAGVEYWAASVRNK